MFYLICISMHRIKKYYDIIKILIYDDDLRRARGVWKRSLWYNSAAEVNFKQSVKM